MLECNSTLADITITEEPLWENGLTFHHLFLIISALFGLISVIIALVLIFQHATHYLKPFEQRHIIRILLMIPVYSTVSFLSYLYYQHAVYFQVLRDCYEAFAIASFFTLLCHYIAPNLHEQKVFFRGLRPINWFWGVFFLQKCTGGENKGPFRKPRSGLTWFNVIWIGVYQYCAIRVAFTILSVVSEVFDRYCEHSLNPAFAHIWVVCFEGASVTVAMFCLIQFYIQLKTDLAEHRPFLKVLCIKLVIFFSFWQTLVISFLASSSGPLQPTPKINYPDIYVGLPNILLCIEMSLFAILHIFAFSPKPYNLKNTKYADPLDAPGTGYSGPPPKYKGGPLGVWAIVDCFNPWDILKASARGFRWLFVGYKHRHKDSSYAPASKVGVMDGYDGPLFAGGGGGVPATELVRPGAEGRNGSAGSGSTRTRADTLATDPAGEDDRAGLLRHSALPAGGDNLVHPQPQRPYAGPYGGAAGPGGYGARNDEFTPGDDSALDLGAPGAHYQSHNQGQMPIPMPMPMGKDDGFGVETGYGGAGAVAGGVGGGVHPAFRDENTRPDGWDHWGGGGGRERDHWGGHGEGDIGRR